MKQAFDVTGMTCAACSARVTKVTQAVDGVDNAVVNLLKNSMEVEYDGNPQTLEAVSQAVSKAGYGATPRVEEASQASGGSGRRAVKTGPTPAQIAEKNRRETRNRLIVSFIFTIPLFYLSMGHMFGWPLPSVFLGDQNLMTFAFTEFLLLLPVLFVNYRYFTNGFGSLVHGAPNMNSLIALGATASTVYGVYAIYSMGAALGAGDMMAAHMAAMDLYFESAAMILALITLGKYFESRAKGKTTDAITKLMDLSPKTAIRLVNGVEQEIPVEEVRVGDTLVVKSGQGIPVDGTVLEGVAAVDESAITGESVPVEKSAGSTVIGATVSKSGWFTMHAEHVGDETALAGIIRMVDEATSSKAPIEKFADKVSGVFVPAVIAIAVVTFIVWMVVGAGLQDALGKAISVLVISCPCALGLATPTAIMVGTGRGATHGILIKSADSLQRAHDIKTVIFDKTGTITTGQPQVVDVITGEGIDRDGLLSVAASLEKLSEHPLAQAICKYADAMNSEYKPVDGFRQTPGEGIEGVVDGKLCLAGNARMMNGRNIDFGSFSNLAETMADEGKTPLFFAEDGKVIGVIAIADTIKPSSARAIAELKAMGVSSIMLTGDNERTARAVQKQCGIDKVIAGVLPNEKAMEVSRASQDGGVAMVGDGINDAPALASADVGIAIGAGTDIAMDSADMVLMRSDLLDVPSAIQLSRATMRNIKQNLFWALIYNAICIPFAAGVFAFAGITLNPMIAAAAMSCSSICVVSNALRLRAWKPKFVTSAQEELTAGSVQSELAAEPVQEELAAGSAQAAIELAPGHGAEDSNSAEQNTGSAEENSGNKASGNEIVPEVENKDPNTVEEENSMEKTLNVEGMMCEHCVAHVTKALEGIDGVTKANVSLDDKKAVVELSKDVADADLVAAVVDAGYEAEVA